MGRRVVQTLPQMFIETLEETPSKLLVAAYARVSTEKEEQEDSFERQVEHYKQMIHSKPTWQYVDIYADPGISGTRAEKRKDFMRMIDDCRAGKIQKVLVKSISRFARNTVDALKYIRELKDLYYVENTHPAIIEKDMFELAKAEMARRKSSKEQVVGGGRFTNKYPFSGMIECGICGGRLRRHVRTVGSGKKVASWGCATRIVNGRQACDSHHVREDVLEATYLAALKDLVDNAEEVVKIVESGVEMSMEAKSTAALAGVEEEIIQLQQAVLDLHKKKRDMEISAEEYADRVKEYSAQMRALEEKRDSMQSTDLKYAEVKAWLDTFAEQALREDDLTAIDGVTMKMLVERIIARENSIEVVFKCGVTIEKEYVR